MTEHEAATANPIKPTVIGMHYIIANAQAEDGCEWLHVCERQPNGSYTSFYRAANHEDALDVWGIYADDLPF